MRALTLEPQVTEKALALVQNHNTYVFLVPKTASKISVSKAVTAQFKVKVKSVTTATTSGKAKETLVQRGRKRIAGKRSDYKKAFVKLAQGESIKIFEEPKK